MMSDVLKNKHLEGAALSFVRIVDDIDETWPRLKSTYGDLKLLLKKKISEINKLGQLWKLKYTEKVVVAQS